MQSRSDLHRTDNDFDHRGYFLDEPRIQGTDFNKCIRAFSEADADYEINNGLVFHVWGRLVGGERKDFCAVFQWADMELDAANINAVVEPEFINCSTMGLLGGHPQQPVLISVLQIPEKAKEGREPMVNRIRAVVRLYALNCCPHGKSQEEVEVVSFHCIPEFRAVIGDGELDTTPMRRRVLPRFEDGNPKGKMIKGRPEIVNAISGNQRPPLKIRLLSLWEFKRGNMAKGIGVVLFDDSVRLTFVPGADFCFERIAVFSGSP